MSVTEKITQLTTIRSDIRTALTDKGIDASEHNFKDFPNDVESIPNCGTDGQFFPMNMTEFILPKVTMTYNGNEV